MCGIWLAPCIIHSCMCGCVDVWMDVMYVCMYVCVFIRLQAASPQFWLGSSYPGRRCPRGEEATPLLRPPSGIRKKTVCTVVRCPGKGSFQHLRRMGGQPCALGLHFAVRGASRKPSFPFCHPELRAGTEGPGQAFLFC